jgi:inner membrane protein
MLWWYWVILGMALAAIEVAGPGVFFFIFFGVGAVAVGLLVLVGIGGPPWVQWLLFSVLSLVSLGLFRGRLLQRQKAMLDSTPGVDDNFVGEVAVAIDDIAPGAHGRAELRGTGWSALNVGPEPIVRGCRCVVRRVDGLLLHLVPEGGH